MNDQPHGALNLDADPQPRRASAVDAVREFFQGFLSVSAGAGG
jgi:hypothetical protein